MCLLFFFSFGGFVFYLFSLCQDLVVNEVLVIFFILRGVGKYFVVFQLGLQKGLVLRFFLKGCF